jgi:hypothetical protein
MKLAETLLLALADEGPAGEVDPALVFAVGAADREVVDALRRSLREVPNADARPLTYALGRELRLAQDAADKLGKAPDTVPAEW